MDDEVKYITQTLQGEGSWMSGRPATTLHEAMTAADEIAARCRTANRVVTEAGEAVYYNIPKRCDEIAYGGSLCARARQIVQTLRSSRMGC